MGKGLIVAKSTVAKAVQTKLFKVHPRAGLESKSKLAVVGRDLSAQLGYGMLKPSLLLSTRILNIDLPPMESVPICVCGSQPHLFPLSTGVVKV